MIRNFFAGILLLAALACALAGGILQWVEYTAGSAEPTQKLATTIARDEAVTKAVADLLQSSIEEQFPEAAQFPGAKKQLEEAVAASVNTALANEDIEAAWQKSINGTRRSLVADLQAYGTGTREPPSVWVDLQPFADIVWETLSSSSDSTLKAALSRIDKPTDTRVKVADVPPSQAAVAADLLALAGYWWAGYALGVLLLVCGLALGTRVARWVLLTLVALVGVAALTVLRIGVDNVSFSGGNQLVSTVGTNISSQLGDSLTGWVAPLWFGAMGLAVLGLFFAIIAGATGRRTEPA